MTTTLNRFFIIKLLLIQICCGLLGLGLGLIFSIILDLSKYDNKLYKNIIIEGIDVGSLTPSEAQNTIQAKYIDEILKKEITLSLDKKVFKASLKEFFSGSNLKDITNTAYNYPNHLNTLERWFFLIGESPKHFDIALSFNEHAVDSFADHIISEINQKANNASISVNKDATIAIRPHTDGYIVNKKELVDSITLALSSSSVKTINILDYAIKQTPARTTTLLESIDTCVTSFSTQFTPNTSRATNIILSAKAINGTLLAPGDTFSFNNTVGETTAEKGYRPAAVIVNSKISQGLGGGICQVSSTLYNAVLRTGLTASDRRPHSIPVSYVPLGLDATVSWDSVDFQFQNTLPYPIYIQAYTKTDRLYVNVYSNHTLKNKSYALKTEVSDKMSSYVQYLSLSSPLTASAKYSRPPRKGSQIKVIREIYEKNALKASELISLDTY